MKWFTEIAPIRQKLLVAFGFMAVLTAIASLTPLFASQQAALAVGGFVTLLAIGTGFGFRSMIANPYVATVVRMEALAAGDLDSKIDFTAYRDCVGRLTRAMHTFKEAAVAQQALHETSKVNAAIVQSMAGNMRRLADCDLTADITADFPAEFAELKTSFNEALANLRGLISGVNASAAGIGTGSQEIAQASEDLARRTESSAASLEETSAALVQIETRLRASAVSSQGTVARADEAIAAVGTGRTTAEGAMQAMSRVSVSAKGIDSVIEGVDKIAFQTRVLAMNAAVEAGRAGDAGRGFAVVADLVSALAMRAEEEAKRARDQLTVTQAEIVTAVDAVRKVDGALADISGDVDAVHTLLASIADDNLAQSAAITQISSAVSSMDRATQQNAAMVEETSAAARNLAVDVAGLAAQAGQFRTGSETSASAAPPRAKPAAASKPAAKRAPAPVARRAANDPRKMRANGAAVADSSDWSDF